MNGKVEFVDDDPRPAVRRQAPRPQVGRRAPAGAVTLVSVEPPGPPLRGWRYLYLYGPPFCPPPVGLFCSPDLFGSENRGWVLDLYIFVRDLCPPFFGLRYQRHRGAVGSAVTGKQKADALSVA